MKKLTSLIFGVALALVTPFALAAMDSVQGGIEAPANSDAFWNAGTGGVPTR